MGEPAFTPELEMRCSSTPSANGAFHLYLADKSGRKVAACWGSNEEKMANGYLWSSAPELYRQVELFAQCIRFNIKAALNKGDDEGARLQSMTLVMAEAALADARGEPAERPDLAA